MFLTTASEYLPLYTGVLPTKVHPIIYSGFFDLITLTPVSSSKVGIVGLGHISNEYE